MRWTVFLEISYTLLIDSITYMCYSTYRTKERKYFVRQENQEKGEMTYVDEKFWNARNMGREFI